MQSITEINNRPNILKIKLLSQGFYFPHLFIYFFILPLFLFVLSAFQFSESRLSFPDLAQLVLFYTLTR